MVFPRLAEVFDGGEIRHRPVESVAGVESPVIRRVSERPGCPHCLGHPAADLLGIRQPDVSKMLRGEFRQFSVERLLRFLVALDQDVGIVVKPHRNRDNAPALQVF